MVCRTTESLPGLADIHITVRRGVRMFTAEFEESVSSKFLYAVPELHSISPSYGSKSGGTLVTISGSALNISNMALTVVRLAGYKCSLREVTFSEIRCISSAAGSIQTGSVQVVIDGAHLSGVFYDYLQDPQFISLQQQFIIPA